MKLDDILLAFSNQIRYPEISNDGYSIDVFAPRDLFLKPGSQYSIDAGFGLNIPEPYIGLLTTKANIRDEFLFTKGQIIHPNYDKELSINMKYIGLDNLFIKKDEPLFQIVLVQSLKIEV